MPKGSNNKEVKNILVKRKCVVLRRARFVRVFPVERCNARALEWTWSEFLTTFLNSSSEFSCVCVWRNDLADLPKVYRQKRLGMPSKDVILLGYRPRSDLQTTGNFRRAVSEDCLLEVREGHTRPAFSMLKLSKTRISVGDSVTVYWDIREQCGANDWIGLFDLGKLIFINLPHLACAYTRLRSLHETQNVYYWSPVLLCGVANLSVDVIPLKCVNKQILIPCGAFKIQIYLYICRVNLSSAYGATWGGRVGASNIATSFKSNRSAIVSSALLSKWYCIIVWF